MKLLSCVLLTSLCVVAKSSAGEHRFPKTDENGIPNYCYSVETYDKPIIKNLILDTTVAPVLAIGLTSATAVLHIFDPKGGYEMMKKGLSGMYSDIKKHYDV